MKKLFTLLVATFFVASLFAQINPGMKITVKSPSSLGGQFSCTSAAFGPKLEYDKPVCGEVLVGNGLTSKEIGCDTIVSSVKGKIAIIKRGTCNFSVKCFNAQKSGAIACIIFNNAAGAGSILMGAGTNGADVTIPCAMVSLEDGNKIVAALATGKVELCMVLPSRSVSQVTAADAIQIPFAQRDTVFPTMEFVNAGTDTIKKIVTTVVIKDPAGKITKLTSTDNVPPTPVNTVEPFSQGAYYPTVKGKYSLTFTTTYTPLDTFRTEFHVTDHSFGNENTVAGTATGAALTAATFATDGKVANILSYYNTGTTATKATYATFGLANYAALKGGRLVSVILYKGNKDAIAGANANNTITLGDLGTVVGDVTDYTITTTEKANQLITVALLNKNKPGIVMDANSTYFLSLQYDGTSFNDSISPAYSLSRTFPIRNSRTVGANGTVIVTAKSYYGGGWSGTEDPIARLHMDGFVGSKDLPVLEATEVSIAPNPATNNVNVALNLNEPAKDVQIGIMDMTGRIIDIIKVGATQKENISIDVSNYTPGTYFLTVKTEKAFRPEKFVKVN